MFHLRGGYVCCASHLELQIFWLVFALFVDLELWPWSSGHLYTQPKVCLPIRESITTTVQHQIAGFQRGLNLSKLATHGYNNVITIYNSYKTHNKEKRNKIRASADAVQQDKCVYRTISRKRKSTT